MKLMRLTVELERRFRKMLVTGDERGSEIG